MAAGLAGIPGLDAEGGLRLCSGRVEIYRQVLRRFADLYGAGMPELDAFLVDGRVPPLHAAAHSLRGGRRAPGGCAASAARTPR
ncbi:hypothetical protein ABXN37_22300 [Piscinibacter sakaiensis]|uniref:hypothetical protein n=1 Tax=Piscinibacter sakaiensis TaxID=1547922 RepID=UPI00372B6421